MKLSIRFLMKILKTNYRVMTDLRSEGIHLVRFDDGKLVHLDCKYNEKGRLVVVMKYRVDKSSDEIVSALTSKNHFKVEYN